MPVPLVVQVMTAHKTALAAQEAQQMAAMARRWSQMEAELQDKVELFTRRVAMDGLTPGQLQSRQFQLDRFGSLLRQVRTELDRYTDYVEPLTVNGQRAAAASGIQVAGTAINAVASDAGVRVAFDRLPIQAVENLVGLAGDGSPLRDLLVNSYGAGADGMLNELIKSTTLGSNPKVTARNMLRNGLGQSLSRMMNISRTEQLRVGRESTRQAYQKSGVVEAYRRLGTKDRRACVACIMADGETLELTESLNEHPSGRCTLIPIVTGLPLIEWEKGRDWLQKASPETQQAVMGKGRFTAWQDGKFDLDQLISVRTNSVWGDSLQPTTLADLLGGTARPYTIREPDPNRLVTGAPTQVIPTLPGPDEIIEFGADPIYEGQALNGIPLSPAEAGYWEKVSDVQLAEPPLPDGRISAGLVVVEEDGRIWVVAPKNQFGGYENTFPKGGVEKGLTTQQNALKEVYEESGLSAEITGYVGDFKGSTGTTRYYLAKRTGGAPWQHDDETEAVKLIPQSQLGGFLNVQRDKSVLKAALESMQRGPAVEPEPVKLPDFVDTFPSDPSSLQVVKKLGGSTGAELVKDPATGQLFVRKKGNNKGHLLEETYADAAYQALGVDVPEFRLYDKDSAQPVKLSKFIDGARSLSDIKDSDPKLYKKVQKELQKNFAADALLGNWDVVGMGADNILVDAKGKPWRIDNGGALRYRAQGALKAEFSPLVDELWTLRNSRINPQTADAYSGIDYFDVAKQMRSLTTKKQRDALLGALPPELHTAMTARLDNLADLGKVAQTFQKDDWKVGYVDEFSRHMIGMRKAGIVDRFPEMMRNDGVMMEDKDGRAWDHLRGPGSIIEDLDRYMTGQGGSMRMVGSWAQQQGGDSWNGLPQAAKFFYTQQTDKDPNTAFWWKEGLDEARDYYEAELRRQGDEAYRQTFTIYHAYNYELVRNVKFKNNNIKKGTVKLMRTEDPKVMEINGFKSVGDKGQMRRGPVESTSIYEEVTVFGSELTVQDIPHHRIFGMYMNERTAGSNVGPFLGDSENEFVVMAEGATVEYKESHKRR